MVELLGGINVNTFAVWSALCTDHRFRMSYLPCGVLNISMVCTVYSFLLDPQNQIIEKHTSILITQ